MLQTHEGWGAVALAAALGGISACGGDAHISPDAPSAPPDSAGPQAITIKIFLYGPSEGGETANATLVAFQDGDAPWAALQGDGGVYHATSSGARYAVAVGCQAVPGIELRRGIAIDYRTVADGTEADETGCGGTPSPTQTAQLSGTLHGIPAGEQGEVTAGTAQGGFAAVASADGSYRLVVPTGQAIDVFARSFASGPNQTQVASKLYRGALPALTADQSLDVDLDTGGAPPQSATLTVQGAGSDTVTVTSSVVSRLVFCDVARQRYAGTAPTSYLAPAATQLTPGDLISVHVTTLQPQSSSSGFRNATSYRAAAAAQTIALVPPWTVNPPTITATPFPRPSFAFPVVVGAPATQWVGAGFSTILPPAPGQPFEGRYLSVFITQRYAEGPSSFAFATPDLSTLPGWNDSMALTTATTVFWNVSLNDDHVASRLRISDADVSTASGVSGQL
jgi:hypothetical protein